MLKQDHGTKINQRVRLKLDGQDALYSNACAGSEGWVRKQDHDTLGYPTIFIEWDKDHWAYNGEADRWALDAHFEPVGGADMGQRKPSKDDFQKALSAFAEQYFSEHVEADEGPEDQDTLAEYQRALALAMEAAQECKSFLLVAIAEGEPQGGYPTWGPVVINYYQDPASGAILEAHLSKLAASAHQQAAIESVKAIIDGDQQ